MQYASKALLSVQINKSKKILHISRNFRLITSIKKVICECAVAIRKKLNMTISK